MPNPTAPTPASVLDLAWRRASDNLDTPLVSDAEIAADVEFVCRCANLSGVRFLMACLVAKLSHPAYDIRKPYTEIGGDGVYSGRHYDETYIAPFAFKHTLPVNPTTSFLTPAFRTNKSLIEPGAQLIGRPKKLYDKVIGLITAAHAEKVSPADLLAEIVRWLLLVRDERKQRLETLLTTLKTSESDASLPVDSIVTLIQQHLALPKSSRLSVLVIAAAYQAAQDYLGEHHLPLEGHTTADKQTGALGDVQITLKDDGNILTVYEMKAKKVTLEDIEIALQKLGAAVHHIDNYVFITTDKIDDEVKDYAATRYATIGIEFVILDCIGFLRHFLHLFYRIRMRFLESYQQLVMVEPDSAVNPTLKEAFLTLRLATETGIAQSM